MQAAKCHVCGREAVIWYGRYILPPDIVSTSRRTQHVVGAGFCGEHRDTKCPNDFGLVGCFGVWDPKYGIEPHNGVGRKSRYHDALINLCAGASQL
jgi:hypothetical protein